MAEFKHLKESYTISEAKKIIDVLLLEWDTSCYIDFKKYGVEIMNSYKVTSTEARHLICEIIYRTGLTNRNYEDLAAEWELHNAAWHAHVGRTHAKDVMLDYNGDPHFLIEVATNMFDKLDLE